MVEPPLPKVDVLPLMIIAEPVAGREKVVPETVTTPPWVRVWPGAMTNAVDEPATLAVIVWPLRVRIGCPVWLDARVRVTPLTTAMEPSDAMLNVVPPTVTAGPPGVNDTPGATEKTPDGFAVMVFCPTTSVGALPAWFALLIATVLLPPITTFPPLGGTETATPLTTVACPG
jgi:hypothetical protein